MWLVVALLGLLAIMIALGPILAPHDPFAMSLSERLTPPNSAHFLGTDELGRDLFSRILASLRLNILGALLPALVSYSVGVLFTRVRHRRHSEPWPFWRMAGIGFVVTVSVGFTLAATMTAAFEAGNTYTLLLVAGDKISAGIIRWP